MKVPSKTLLAPLSISLFLGLASGYGENLTYSDWVGGVDDNNFSLSSNWSDGVPGTDDYGRVHLAGIQNLRLTGSVDLQGLVTSGAADGEIPPAVNLDLGGFTMTLLSTSNSASSFPNTEAFRPIYLNSISGTGNRQMTITNGILNVNGIGMQNSNIAGIKSILTIGEGATVNLLPSSPETNIGNLGQAEMFVQDGARLVVGTTGSSTVRIGSGANASGLLRVTGENSEVDARNTTITVGRNGNGVLEVLNEGWFRATRLDLGTETGDNSNGTLRVSGPGSKVDISDILYVGGTSGGKRGDGTFEVLDGATATIGRVRLFEDTLLHIHGGTLTMDGETASVWDSGSTFRVTYDDVPAGVAVDATVLNLNGVGFQLLLGDTFSALPGELIPILSYTSLTGTFAGLSEGSIIQATAGSGEFAEDYFFSISYALDDLDMIGLVVIPEPRYAVLIIALASVLVLRRRAKRQPGAAPMN